MVPSHFTKERHYAEICLSNAVRKLGINASLNLKELLGLIGIAIVMGHGSCVNEIVEAKGARHFEFL